MLIILINEAGVMCVIAESARQAPARDGGGGKRILNHRDRRDHGDKGREKLNFHLNARLGSGVEGPCSMHLARVALTKVWRGAGRKAFTLMLLQTGVTSNVQNELSAGQTREVAQTEGGNCCEGRLSRTGTR
jgi:hypothetical protein